MWHEILPIGGENRDPVVRLARKPLTTEPIDNILHVWPTFEIGGAQRRFAAIVNHFGTSFRHIILPLSRNCDARVLLQDNGSWTIETPNLPASDLIRNVVAARRNLRKIAPDVLVTYNWGAIEWAAANMPPIARHVHIEDGFGSEEAKRQLRRRVWFRRLVLNRHSTIVLPSRKLIDIALGTWRLSAERVLYVPNGIACDRFGRPPDPNLSAVLGGKGPVVGTVATLRPEKALDRLIEAFALVRAKRPCHLAIVGDGSERARLSQLVIAKNLSEHVTFFGQVGRPEEILNAFTVFAMSSDTEQMPLSLLEAMAAGLPVACTDAGDIREMISNENKAFVVPMSAPALAGAIDTLLADTGLQARLGNENRKKAFDTFGEGRMFETYGKVFQGRLPLVSRAAG